MSEKKKMSPEVKRLWQRANALLAECGQLKAAIRDLKKKPPTPEAR